MIESVDIALGLSITAVAWKLYRLDADYRRHTHQPVANETGIVKPTGLSFMSDPNPELSANCKCGHQHRKHVGRFSGHNGASGLVHCVSGCDCTEFRPILEHEHQTD